MLWAYLNKFQISNYIIQVLKQQNIAIREKVRFDKKWERLPKRTPQMYLSISEADTKAKVYKNSKRHKSMQWHMQYIFTQKATSQAQIFQ